jgi:hypothetical protein
MKLMNFWYFLGANSETQWYCPPEVGALESPRSESLYRSAAVWTTYIEAISAMDVLTAKNPIQATRYIQIMPAVPPLMSPMILVPKMVSYEAIRIMEKPKMETKRKFRYQL